MAEIWKRIRIRDKKEEWAELLMIVQGEEQY